MAPNTEEEHECLNCHDRYVGKYCPHCGQPATTTRFIWKVAIANFVNAYGLGERGMFRSMGNLLLRPGYLILDYLRGLRWEPHESELSADFNAVVEKWRNGMR
ncbi:MAG: DUF3667 domain-containing protein [Paludibacteraceae bacterium]|nr:DUF3667 domain-containing protein [Paludibacteraceae bacterium]